MRSFATLDLDHETGITVVGHADEVGVRVFRNSGADVVELTRVFWANPDDLDDDEWLYDEQPLYIRPEVVRAVGGLPKQQANALERACLEVG